MADEQGPEERQLEVATSTGVRLVGDLVHPASGCGIVVFAHGSGSSRHSPRNRFVARRLNDVGLSTLLLDLLTEEEDRDRAARFDIDTLTERLVSTVDLVRRRHGELPCGVFGASTGAAGALAAAAARPDDVVTVVSRGGRPDLAADLLGIVRAPTLLIVGGADRQVLELNRRTLPMLPAGSTLEIVAGATHLFGEPGALERVADLAVDWFHGRLCPGA